MKYMHHDKSSSFYVWPSEVSKSLLIHYFPFVTFFFLEQEVLQINLHAAWESSLNL